MIKLNRLCTMSRSARAAATACATPVFNPCSVPNSKKATPTCRSMRIVRAGLRRMPDQMSGRNFMKLRGQTHITVANSDLEACGRRIATLSKEADESWHTIGTLAGAERQQVPREGARLRQHLSAEAALENEKPLTHHAGRLT